MHRLYKKVWWNPTWSTPFRLGASVYHTMRLNLFVSVGELQLMISYVH
jgi:hypothetical protein